ncbi:hypothetical protein SUGI_0085980 [Cryptomeria japonica]|nr:hypothetical protein SUGI_0085980 [Cryptomeria japonica]
MQHRGVKANEFSFASALSSCGDLSAAQEGKQVHAYIVKTGFEFNSILLNAMVDMGHTGKHTRKIGHTKKV